MEDQYPQSPAQSDSLPIQVAEATNDSNTLPPQKFGMRRASLLRDSDSMLRNSVGPRPIEQLLREYPPSVLENSEPSSQNSVSSRENNIHEDDGAFSVLIVALYLQHLSKSRGPGIFLYRNQTSEPVGQDEEKNAPDSPQSWLQDILPGVLSTVVEFHLDLPNSQSEVDKVARYIRTRAQDISAAMTGNKYIVFFTHGYGSLVLQQALQLDDPVAFRTSTAAVITFANPFVSLDAARVVSEWTKAALSKARKGTTFLDPKPDQPTAFRRIMTENSILLQEYWERPLSNEPFNDRSKKPDLSTIAEVTGGKDKDFQKICRIVQRAINDHRVFMAAKSPSAEAMTSLINDGYDISAVTYQSHNVLHLAVQAQNPKMVELLIGCRLSKRLIKQRDRQGNTALHIAITSKETGGNGAQISIVKTLFNSGASRVAKSSEGLTPMNLSAQDGSVKDIINQPQRIGRLFVPVLSKGEPPGQKGRDACNNTEITITNISTIKEKVAVEPEEIVKVQELLYSERKLSDLIRISQEKGSLTCQWFHIPTNNVRCQRRCG